MTRKGRAATLREITSSSNEICKQVKKLLSSRGYRRDSGRFVTEGKRLFSDALASGLQPLELLLSSGLSPDERLEYASCCERAYLLPQSLMTSLSDTRTPQGVMAVFPLPKPSAAPVLEGDKLLILVSLQDPGNVGTILRTAEAFGIGRVILSADCPDLYSPKLLRATMGGVFRLPITVTPDIPGVIGALRAQGVRVLAAALREGALPLDELDLRGRVCAVVGNEGNGLPDEIIGLCSGAAIIPMKGAAESLNAAMAAGIFLCEMTKND